MSRPANGFFVLREPVEGEAARTGFQVNTELDRRAEAARAHTRTQLENLHEILHAVGSGPGLSLEAGDPGPNQRPMLQAGLDRNVPIELRVGRRESLRRFIAWGRDRKLRVTTLPGALC
jgi:hypothetical protein